MERTATQALGARGSAHPSGSVFERRRACASAFTLLELLVVIGIISVLVTIGIVVGNAVTGGAREKLTEDTIRVLDMSLDAYIAAKGGNPEPVVNHPDPVVTESIPVADADGGAGLGVDPIVSIGWYLIQTKQVESARTAVDGLNAKLVKLTPTPGWTSAAGDPGFRVVKDAWGNPIRYVHPAFHGLVYEGSPNTPKATSAILGSAPGSRTYRFNSILRNATNSDSGRTTGQRPYFYSAGPDGNPATTEDNIYTTKPQFVK